MRDADRRSQDRITASHDVGQNHRFRLPPEGQFHLTWCSIHSDIQPSTLGAADAGQVPVAVDVASAQILSPQLLRAVRLHQANDGV